MKINSLVWLGRAIAAGWNGDPILGRPPLSAFARVGMIYTWSALFMVGVCVLMGPSFRTWGWMMTWFFLGGFVPAGFILLIWFFFQQSKRDRGKLKPSLPGPLFDPELDG